MKLFSIDKIADFKCIGGKCPDTCCAGGWDSIPIDEKTYEYYMNVKGSLGEELKKGIIRSDSGETKFIMDEQGRCPFLNEDKLCRLVLAFGEEALCFTCDTYPRKKELFGDVIFAWLSISCPEAARQLLSRKEKLTSYLADYDGPVIKCPGEYDRHLFDIFIASFADCIGIIQERSLSIGERLSACLLFIYQLETNISLNNDSSGLLELFSDPDNIKGLVTNLDHTADIASKIRLFNFVYRAMGKSGFKRYDNLYGLFEKFLSYFQNNDINDISEELCKYYECFKEESLQTELEQLLVYLVTHYYFKDFSRKCFMRNTAIITVIFQLYICFSVFSSVESGHFTDFDERILFVSRLSRLFEHNQTIMDDLYEKLEMMNMNSLEYLMQLAMI